MPPKHAPELAVSQNLCSKPHTLFTDSAPSQKIGQQQPLCGKLCTSYAPCRTCPAALPEIVPVYGPVGLVAQCCQPAYSHSGDGGWVLHEDDIRPGQPHQQEPQQLQQLMQGLHGKGGVPLICTSVK
eukprot:scaffold40030_cov24-Tisochrysis_lutea.AAC.1